MMEVVYRFVWKDYVRQFYKSNCEQYKEMQYKEI